MVKKISGYVRSIQTAVGIPEKTDSIRFDDALGLVVPPGGIYGASDNPTVTDANGYFEWTTELSPGPVRAEADVLDGVEVKINSGKETMQVGDVFLSDLSQALSHLADGVLWSVGALGSQGLFPQAITGQREVTIAAGAANMRGRLWQITTPRTVTIDANTTLATRIDRIVLEQHVGGATIGRQNLAVIKGTVAGVVPASNADPDVFQFPIAEVTISQNASSVTVVDKRVYAYPHYINIPNNFINIDMLGPTVDNAITAASVSWPGLTAQEDGVNKNTATKTINFTGNTTVNTSGNTITVNTPTPTVGTSNITDLAVTAAKIANATITGGKIAANTITSGNIASGAITSSELGANSVTSAAIAAGTIVESDLATELFKTRHLRQIFPSTHRLKLTAADHKVRFTPGTDYDTGFVMEPGTPLHRFTEDSVTIGSLVWYYCYVYWRGFGWVGWISNDFEVWLDA